MFPAFIISWKLCDILVCFRAVESKFRLGSYYTSSNSSAEYASLPYMGYSSLCDTQHQGKFVLLFVHKRLKNTVSVGVKRHHAAKNQYQNSKLIFPEKELRGHSPNFHIHVSVSDLYIFTIDLPILLQETCGSILGTHKSLTDTWMWKWGLRPRNSQKRNTYRVRTIN